MFKPGTISSLQLTMDSLTDDITIRICSYLRAHEVLSVSTLSKYWHRLVQHSFLWEDICRSHHLSEFLHGIIQSQVTLRSQYDHHDDAPNNVQYLQQSALIEHQLLSLNSVQWHRKNYCNQHMVPQSALLDSIEAHAMLTLFNSRLIIVVGAWGDSNNSIFALDARRLPSMWAIRAHTINMMDFSYGFTATAIDPIANPNIIVYGGCTNGGYSGDCNGTDNNFE